jgi:hypothetical protein
MINSVRNKKTAILRGINHMVSVKFFLAIYNQIAPKLMRQHHVIRTKTQKKWMKKPNQHQNMDEIVKFVQKSCIWMDVKHFLSKI